VSEQPIASTTHEPPHRQHNRQYIRAEDLPSGLILDGDGELIPLTPRTSLDQQGLSAQAATAWKVAVRDGGGSRMWLLFTRLHFSRP